MLQLKHIRKSYTTGDFAQTALDDVSVSFRDSEFVAILGPSGSGKTTLLNIIGGLDHYDTGDLVVDGVSTKEYKDRDWDTFRNNRIGFVFQSYNLIPHQTVLANVELALTLSGVAPDERKRRATEALEAVGLGDHVNKKPAQLSGGQMQRVAIARALINDPEILLADEPTGALDSKTSVQIMDLLTDIARDRLVIMVTHNPELAEQYATRTVNLADGVIRSDTAPFEPTAEEMRLSEKPIRRTSMSFLTALTLSFNNLMTKKGRTIMTAFAGSIGIIGIAAILALANGVNAYIKNVEEETLSVYPLQIMSTGFDMSSMMTMSGMGMGDDGEGAPAEGQGAEGSGGEVGEATILTRMFTSITNNDLASLKEYFDTDGGGIEQHVSSIEYTYNVTPHIYVEEADGGVRQVNPDTTFNSLGMGAGMSDSSLMSMSMSTNVFGEMMDNADVVKDQYDVIEGAWPEAYDECVLVLSHNGKISDFLAYVLGLRDYDHLQEMVKSFVADDTMEVEVDTQSYPIDELLSTPLKLVNSADCYTYDDEYGVWVDKTDDEAFVKDLVANGESLRITGIVQPKEGVTATALASGIYYTPALPRHLIEQSAETQIVKDQLADPDVNVFTGKPFGEEDQAGDFDMGSMFTIDTGAISRAFNVDASKLQVDMSGMNLDPSSLPQMGPLDLSGLDLQTQPEIDEAQLQRTMAEMAMAATPEEKNAILNRDLPLIITNLNSMQAEAAGKIQAAVGQQVGGYVSSLTNAIQQQTQAAVGAAMAQMGANMASAMSVDPAAFADAFQFNMTEEQLTELIMSMMGSAQEATFDNNLAKMDYADLAKPYEIDIYPKDFESKQEVIAILDAYNERMAADGDEDREITYTDLVGTLMKSVTTIIDMISYVLIAFVSISLVVSSIMIGVITYISVLERKKEIGILRAIGASKGDISRVFNAETIIEGLVAGVLGVGITALVCIPVSALVYALFDVPNLASLPWQAALILIGISVALTFIAGLMPASSAARKDPVEALRSE